MRHSLLTLILAGILSTVSLAAHAIEESHVPDNKRTELGLYLTPEEAWDMISEAPDQVLFLDVRTRAEAAIVGMPTAADGLVPFSEYDPFWHWDDERENYKMEPLQDFVPEAEHRLHAKGLSKDDAVIVMCRTGGRSAKAADRLAQAGYTKVYSIIEGFEGDVSEAEEDKGRRTVNGWKNAGLPWSYDLNKDKVYLPE